VLRPDLVQDQVKHQGKRQPCGEMEDAGRQAVVSPTVRVRNHDASPPSSVQTQRQVFK